MKKLSHIIAAMLLAWTSVSPAFAGEPVRCIPLRPVSAETLPFQAGEELVFNIHCKVGLINANVAKGYLTVDTAHVDGIPVYRAGLTGKTAKFYDAFFKIREDFTTWLRTSDLKPLVFDRDTREGGYFAKDQYYYHWEGEPYIDAHLNNKKKGERQMTLALDECTFDIITLFYRLRNVDLDRLHEKEHFEMSFVLGSKAKKAQLVYLGQETIELKQFGRVQTHKFTMVQDDPEVVEGSEEGDSNMYLWFSADDNRIPVRFIAPAKVGMISGRLNSCSGLRFPFTAVKED